MEGQTANFLYKSVYIRAGNCSTEAFDEGSVLFEGGILRRFDGKYI
jgi:hypothetical protein